MPDRTPFTRHRRARQLDAYWDSVVGGSHDLPRVPIDIDREDALLVRRVQSLAGSPEPDETFAARLEQTLMNTYVPTAPSPLTEPLPGMPQRRADRPPSRTGSRDAAPVSRRRSAIPPSRTGWPLRPAVAIGLVIVLVLGSLGGLWMLNTGQDEPHRLLAPVVATPDPDASPDVPMYRANPERTGIMPGPGIDGEPVELWRIEIPGEINAAAVVVNEVAYISATNGVLYALDAVTGETMWEYETPAPVPVTVAVVGGVVYGGSGGAALFALNVDDGSELWTVPDIQPSGALMIVKDILYAGAADGNLYALDLDGSVLWRASLGDAPLRSPALSDDLVYAGNETGALRAFDRATGEPVWSFQTEGGGFAPTPMIANGVIYQTTAEGAENYIYALDAISGEQRWRYEEIGNPGWFAGGTDGEVLFIPSANGALYALDATTGEVIWQEQYGDFANAAPAIVDDLVYFAGQDGFVRALESANGEERWRFPIDGPASFGPAVLDGVVYVGTDFGVMHAITGSGTAATPTADATSRAAATPIASAATPTASTGHAEFVWQVGQDDGLSGQPFDVTIAPDGTIWAMGEGQFNLLDQDGSVIETWAGPGPSITPGLSEGSIHFDRDGNFYIVDARNYRVLKFGPDGTFLASISGRGDGEGQLSIPARMGIDQEDNIYVPDGSQVEVFASDGTFLRSVGLSDTGIAIDAAVDANGNIFVSDVVKNQIQAYDPAGNLLGSWGTFGREPGNFIEVDAVTVDDLGNLYVVDFGNQRIQKFELTLPATPGATPIN